MAVDEIEWKAQVHRALVEGERTELLRLFAYAEELFGSEAGSKWAAALSGFAACAVTG